MDDTTTPGSPIRAISLSSGDYIIDRPLGRGGMAEVYLAHRMGPRGFSRKVVIKRILPAFTRNPSFVKRFVREASIAARLHHPGIIQILELESTGDNYYIVMEYLNGRNLDLIADRLRQLGAIFPPWFAARIAADVASALHYAHSFRAEDGSARPIIHRDVSPDNIMLTQAGQVKLLDFGVAKDAEGSALTQVGQIMGKPAFFSPEAARGEMPTPLWDVYALGAVLYEILAGRPPFDMDGPNLKKLNKLFKQIIKDDPTPLHQLNPVVPDTLEKIVFRAMAKKPDERYPSAKEFQQALEAYLATQSHPTTPSDLATFLTETFENPTVVSSRTVESLIASPPNEPIPSEPEPLFETPTVKENPFSPIPSPPVVPAQQPARSSWSLLLACLLALLLGFLIAWRAPWLVDGELRTFWSSLTPIQGPVVGAGVANGPAAPEPDPTSIPPTAAPPPETAPTESH